MRFEGEGDSKQIRHKMRMRHKVRMMAMGAVPVLLLMMVFAPIIYVPAVQASGCNFSCASGGHPPIAVSVAQELFGFGACVEGSNYYFPC
jgi:hypothetical protein